MKFVIYIISSAFNLCLWAAVIAIIAIVCLCWWLYRLIRQDREPQDQTNNYDYYDGSAHCIYGYTYEERFCVNCDLVEQCQGWSPRKERREENDTISDFLMLNSLLDSGDDHDNKEPHVHDSFNCDNAWCECHEMDGYSWFDENGDEQYL